MKTSKLTIQDLTGGWSKEIGVQTTVSRNTSPNGYTSGGNVHFSKPGYLGDISSSPNVENVIIDSAAYNGKLYTGTSTLNGDAWFMTTLGTTYKRTALGNFVFIDDIGAVTRPTMGMWTHISSVGDEVIVESYVQNGGGWLIDFINPISNVRTNLITYTGLLTEEYDYPRKGIVGAANKSYFTNGKYISTYDPVTNTFSRTALLLGNGWISTSICEYGNFVAIVAYRGNGQSKLFIWDGSSTNANYSYNIPDSYVSAIKNDGGALYVFCSGKNNTTKIRTFTGNDFSQEPLYENEISYIGLPPQHDGVDFYSNQLFWTNAKGTIFSYGTPNKNKYSSGFHSVGQLNVPDGQGGGLCKNLQKDILFMGGDYASNGLTNVFTTTLTNASSQYQGTLTSKLYELPEKSTINKIKIYFSDWGKNYCIFDIELFKDYTLLDLLETQDINISNNIGFYHEINCSIPDVNSFYFKLRMGNCSIRKIEIFYSFTDENA
jgi:hypothetical protein